MIIFHFFYNELIFLELIINFATQLENKIL